MAAWLTYGVDDTDRLISIESIPRGRCGLHCPYCGRSLTAKKGRKLAHHFAHAEATCNDVRRSASELPTLPCYDRFNLGLTPTEIQKLAWAWEESNQGKDAVLPSPQPTLLILGMLRVKRSGRHEFTERGKIPFGGLSMRLFSVEQAILIGQRMNELSARVARAIGQGTFSSYAYCEASIQQPLTDLRLYRAQLRRVLELDLYYLKIQADGEILYKIGVTRRPSNERIEEVRRDLSKHFTQVTISLIGRWARWGSCELYFKHRYRSFNRPIGSLSEYFQFPDEATAKEAIQDLRKLKSRHLNELEQAVLSEEPSYVEQMMVVNIEAYQRYERSQAIKAGMRQAAHSGSTVGRSAGRETAAQFLAKPKSRAISAALEKESSVRQVAKQTGTAINTVRKVKRLLATAEAGGKRRQ